jgi:hypothetical protein
MIDQTVGRVLDLFGIDTATFPRWGESCPVTSDIQPCAAASSARQLADAVTGTHVQAVKTPIRWSRIVERQPNTP